MEQLSRRSFLAASALTGAGVLGVAMMSGCASTATAEEVKPDPTEFYECDVVVCGTGTAGLSAAFRLRELGADVIVVEALSEEGLGGNSKYVEGLSSGGSNCIDGVWSPNTDPGIIEYGFKVLKDYCNSSCDLKLLRKWINGMNDILDWTTNVQGIKYKGLDIPLNSTMMAPPLSYEEDEAKTIPPGKYTIMQMYDRCKEMGAQFVFDARATELIVGDDGAVRGVICDHLDGSRLRVDARAVIMATGGFSADRELIEEFTHYSYDALIPYGTSGSQRGDAIRMGRTVNALLHHPEALMFCSPVLPGYFNKGALTICGVNQADTCFFNERGERFCNEECIKDWATSGNLGAQQKHIFVVVDDDFVEKIETAGPVTKRTNYFVENEPVPVFRSEIEEALTRENPRVVKGNTIEEVAEQLGIEPAALKAHIDQWNGYVDAGVDADFQKDPKYMRKIQTPPFYGFKTMLAFYGTVGGMKVDEYARVMDKSHAPIPGFYAAGSDAGGLFGGTYDVAACPGSEQMWCRSSAKWAAEHIVEEYIPSLA